MKFDIIIIVVIIIIIIILIFFTINNIVGNNENFIEQIDSEETDICPIKWYQWQTFTNGMFLIKVSNNKTLKAGDTFNLYFSYLTKRNSNLIASIGTQSESVNDNILYYHEENNSILNDILKEEMSFPQLINAVNDSVLSLRTLLTNLTHYKNINDYKSKLYPNDFDVFNILTIPCKVNAIDEQTEEKTGHLYNEIWDLWFSKDGTNWNLIISRNHREREFPYIIGQKIVLVFH